MTPPTPPADRGVGAARRARVAAHYDDLSPHYASLWGEHIHHGLYERGDEGRDEATRNLLVALLGDLGVAGGDAVLDVGCGLGGTCRALVTDHGCRVTGLTLSPVQARMAAAASPRRAGAPRYVVGDAGAMPFSGPFDALVAIEVLSHVTDRGAFFVEVGRLLRPDGRIAIAAWLKNEEISDPADEALIARIEEGMLVTLPDRREYEGHLAASGLRLLSYRDVSREVAPTWDLCLEIVRRPAVWSLALHKGGDALAFVRSFRDMRRGFSRGVFRYALLTAGKGA